MKVDAYVSEMEGELDALRDAVHKAGRPQLLPLDFSYESIDRAEDYYRLVLDKRVTGGNPAKVADRLVRYVGATLIEHAGGQWAAGPYESDPVCVTKMKAVPKATFLPVSRVAEVKNAKFLGLLRERTEKYDLPLQRAHIAELTKDLDGTLRTLGSDIKELTGKGPGTLDGELDSLDQIEPAFVMVKANKASRELRRRLRAAATIYIGHVLQGQLGAGAWTVEEEPRNTDLGEWQLFDANVGRYLGLVDAGKPGKIRSMVERLIEDRKPSKKKS